MGGQTRYSRGSLKVDCAERRMRLNYVDDGGAFDLNTRASVSLLHF